MRLSYIIPVYNVETYLDECLESVFNQGLEEADFEVLLIDDGSTDSSLQIANQWVESHSNVRVFHQNNQGQAVARNLGIDKACGDYIMFVDSDDYIMRGKIYEMMSKLESMHLDAILYNLSVQKEDGTNYISRLPSLEYNHIYSGEEVALREFVFGSMCRGIYIRSVFEKNSIRYETGFAHEDTEICFQVYPLLSTVMYVDIPVYFYRYNAGSTDRSKNPDKIRYNIESNAIVISKLLQSIETGRYSLIISKRYHDIAISSMMSFYLMAKKERIWKVTEFDDKVNWLKKLNVYPVRGYSKSWESGLMLQLLNIKVFLRLFLFGFKL